MEKTNLNDVIPANLQELINNAAEDLGELFVNHLNKQEAALVKLNKISLLFNNIEKITKELRGFYNIINYTHSEVAKNFNCYLSEMDEMLKEIKEIIKLCKHEGMNS